jgi:cadmium resistance protein CadD (predicted permease)
VLGKVRRNQGRAGHHCRACDHHEKTKTLKKLCKHINVLCILYIHYYYRYPQKQQELPIPTPMIGLIGATLTVAATTIDDAIWLVPYVTSGPLVVRWIHMTTFVVTLVALALMCVVVSRGLVNLVPSQDSWILGAIGAGLCWAIAIGLYVKKWLKKRRRAAAQQQQQLEAGEGYGAVVRQEENEEEETMPLEASPWTVASLTFLGALDEISYFPALLVGHIFTGWELVAGAFLAACGILVVISMFLVTCRPVIEWLDRIPLYNVVGFFAVILTGGL